MPTDTNESSMASTSITTLNENNNGSSSLTTTTTEANHIRSPSLQTQTLTTTRPNSPLQSPSKQLDELRRFLSTLYHFGSDISDETGERVRALILALVNNALSVEEFHGKLQAATNFPLRPFALPFLKAEQPNPTISKLISTANHTSTLPLFQKDLSQSARQSKQSINQYLAQHEELIFLSRDMLENDISPLNENGKRKLSDDSNELDDRPHAAKRSSVNLNHRAFITPIRRDFREKERVFSAYLHEYTTDYKDIEDDWKNTENMLNCILEMVTKSKRVLFMLQQKDVHRRRLIESNDLEWRRRYTELITQTDDRIVEVRRKAEETVLEIKRQSIVDLQKAVSQTEQKSNATLLREREQYQRLKAQTFEEAYAVVNRQEEGLEQCWHCARKAIETCSGCNIARYCGQYCQHRDWEVHQKLCGPDFKRKFNDNPQFYHRSIPKTISLKQEKDDLIITPSQNVSSPNSDKEKSEIVNEI